MSIAVSIVIITFNEAANIAAVLESVRWAAEIIVVDAESTDQTVAIAQGYGARVIVRPWPGYAAQKEFASQQAQYDWVLSIDADERVTEHLANEIQQIVEADYQGERDHQGYYISRQNYYLGQPIYYSGWAPDYQLRFYRRGVGHWHGAYVHESLKVAGTVGYLTGKLAHYTITSLTEHHQRLDRYTNLAAAELIARHCRVGYADLVLRPIVAFGRSYFWRWGWRDGCWGLLIAYFAGYYVFLKYAKAWEKRRS
jgi:(heptosyl)LPS beta-1,4-glucosyltransferase